MNYFAHYFFSRNDDAYYNTGLILPDFSRSAEGRRKLLLEKAPPSAEFSSLKNGCLNHYECDEWFHESSFFKQACSFLEEELKTISLGSQKKWFLAHILAEMLLDRMIIDRFPDELDSFYRDLNHVDWAKIETFLMHCGKSNFDRFHRHQEAFREHKYLYYYKEDQGLIESLDRVSRRTGQEPFTDKAREEMISRCQIWLPFISQLTKPVEMNRFEG